MGTSPFATAGGRQAVFAAACGAGAVALGYVLVMALPRAVGLPLAFLGGASIGSLLAALHRTPVFAAQERTHEQLADRLQLAREIHDGPTQAVADLVIRAGAARTLIAAGRTDEAAAELAALEEAARDAVRDLRQTIAGLRSEAAGSRSLAAAIESQAQAFARRYAIPCEAHVNWPPATPLPAGAAHELLRITQEALTNVRRHAPEARVVVRLEATHEIALLSIEDNGPGAAGHPGDRRFGIQGMRERAERIGGRLLLESGPRGTRVQVLLPLQGVRERERSCPAHR